ncbi:putative DNA-binding protein [Caldalkalibacillus salinus]|uniref:putative DNA-binding protein n=1 Tax=Caldalkalibacillus salinus TaxID=2803787 RepID=UPI0019232CF8|nr:putative DNA-binding protein [Caldalkalibacillus salinus]
MLEKTTRVNLLYDFYQPLLTDKQRRYMALYYSDDYSLSEIAEECQVSRQAVFDNIKRAEQLLEHFEEQLQLLAKHQQREQLLQEATNLLQEESSIDLRQLRNVMNALKKVD